MESYDSEDYMKDELLSRSLREQPRHKGVDEELEEGEEEEDGESGEEGEGIRGNSILDSGTTTKDPSIPENPVGLRDPSVLLGEWEEVPEVRQSQAFFK